MDLQTSAVIRQFELSDADSFHSALDSVAQERKYLTFLQAPPIEDFRQFVQGMLEKANPQFVAVDNRKVVGWCDINRSPRPTHAHRGSLGMGLIASHRGQGLGFQLIKAAIAKAKEVGIRRIELGVHAGNPAISLYEKVGFVVEGTARDAVYIDGKYIDVINMALIQD